MRIQNSEFKIQNYFFIFFNSSYLRAPFGVFYEWDLMGIQNSKFKIQNDFFEFRVFDEINSKTALRLRHATEGEAR